jgi:hypothetical protein
MKVVRSLAIAIVAALAIASAGCYESESPLDATPLVPIDSRVLGAWRCVGPDPSDDAITVTVAASTRRRYLMTWEESGKKPDRYEGYIVALKGTMLFNVREAPSTPESHWFLVHVDFLRSNVALMQVVHEELLKDLNAAAVRSTLERQRTNRALYEKEPLVCIQEDRP